MLGKQISRKSVFSIKVYVAGYPLVSFNDIHGRRQKGQFLGQSHHATDGRYTYYRNYLIVNKSIIPIDELASYIDRFKRTIYNGCILIYKCDTKKFKLIVS